MPLFWDEERSEAYGGSEWKRKQILSHTLEQEEEDEEESS